MTFLSLSLYDTPGPAPRMNILYWGLCAFPVSYSNRDNSFNTLNRRYGDLIQQYEVSLSWMLNWHSDTWPVTVTSEPIRLSTNFITLMPGLTFTELRVISMYNLQWVWLASRECLPFWTPGSVPLLGTCLYSHCWDQFNRTMPYLFSTFHLEYPSVLPRFCDLLTDCAVSEKLYRTKANLRISEVNA